MSLIEKLIRKTKTYKELENKKIISQQELIESANAELAKINLRVTISRSGVYDLTVKQTGNGPQIVLRHIG